MVSKQDLWCLTEQEGPPGTFEDGYLELAYYSGKQRPLHGMLPHILEDSQFAPTVMKIG